LQTVVPIAPSLDDTVTIEGRGFDRQREFDSLT
jgi:hypothetical protein